MKPASKTSSPRVPKSTMHRRVVAALALSAATFGAPFGAGAAGLGQLKLLSALGQPLRAEIDLTAVPRDEAGNISVRLAGADAYSQANIEYGSALSTLRFSIQRRPSGQPFVLMTSNQAVNEPFLDVLVELNWSGGRLVREYTMLLDPPDARIGRREVDPGPAVVPAQTSRAPARNAARAPVDPGAADRSAGGGGGGRASMSAPARPSPGLRGDGGGGGGSDYVVQRGDTALSIARNNQPEGVALDQMLAALYRNNPSAFGGDINRLMAGATVRIPDAAAAQAVDRAEARRIVVARSEDFGSYSQRLARSAGSVPAARASGPQASGRLTTRVDEPVAGATANTDRLQLSKPELGKPSPPAAAPGLRAGSGAQQSSDELAAKDRELSETKARLALLEKSVADLQQLLALKSQTLADLQKGPGATAAAPTPSATPSSPPTIASPAPATPAPAPTPAASAPAPAAVSPPPLAAPAPAPTVAAPAIAPAPKAAPAPINRPATEPGFLESLLENPLFVVAILIVLVLIVGYGIFTVQRRRKLARFEDSIFVDNSALHPNSVFGTTGGQSVDTANSGFHSNFVPVGGNLPEQNEVDPVAEADVYIAYGRDAQAEEILKEALRADGSRQAVRLKLLEIYAKRGDTKNFETMATELYAESGGQGEEWRQAMQLGQSIDPSNPLYRESAPAGASVDTSAPRGQAMEYGASLRSPTTGPSTMPGAAGAAALGAATAGAALSATHTGTEHMKTDPLPRDEPSRAGAPAPAMDLDFDLGFGDLGPAPAPATARASAGSSEASDKAGGLDFDVGGANKSLIEPFTTSAFGSGDPGARTAVNLPAFRARAEQEPTAPRPLEGDSFTASDIFGSSIVGPTGAPELPFSAEPPKAPPPSATQERPRDALGSQQFDETEAMSAFSMSKINLDLDKDDSLTATNLRTDITGKSDQWQAMATKLDLAMAYSDIGDKEGARELLEEVVRNGDDAQSDRARQLITELGHGV